MLKKRWKEIVVVFVLCISLYAGFKGTDKQEPVSRRIEIVETKSSWKGFDSLSFSEAFNTMYAENGKGHVFNWRGSNYLTLYKEEN